MNKQEQINRLQFRIERIESQLAEQHKGNNFNLSEKPNSCDHLLPAGYEFCTEEEAVKWVNEIGSIVNFKFADLVGIWYPIRPTQYHVAVHEAVTVEANPYAIEKHGDGWAIYKGRDLMHHGANLGQINDEELAHKVAMLLMTKESEHKCKYCGVMTSQPDDQCYKNPYAVDWSNAPDWADVHCFDKNGEGHWYGAIISEYYEKWLNNNMVSGHTLPTGLDWKLSKTTRP